MGSGADTGSPPRMRGKLTSQRSYKSLIWITPADAGKTPQFVILPEQVVGSPPRMRGKPARVYVDGMCLWITPADAGKTCGDRAVSSSVWDHPRGCGENLGTNPTKARHLGSPPRMRGKPQFSVANLVAVRITPADAGKTSRHSRKSLTA